MLFLQHLSERFRFLVYALGVIALPYFLIIILNTFPFFKQGLENWAQKIFSEQDSYTHWQIDGPVIQKGTIRFKSNISLNEAVRRAGGAKFGYRIPLENKEIGVIDLFPQESQNKLSLIYLDITDFLEKKNPFKKKHQYTKTNNSYHGKIRKNFLNKKGGENERKSRYR